MEYRSDETIKNGVKDKRFVSNSGKRVRDMGAIYTQSARRLKPEGTEAFSEEITKHFPGLIKKDTSAQI